MGLQSIATYFKTRCTTTTLLTTSNLVVVVSITTTVLLLSLTEAGNAGTFDRRDVLDVLSNSTKCSSEATLELKINGSSISTLNGSHAVSDGDEVEITCKLPNPVSLRYIGYPLLNKNKEKVRSSSGRLSENCFYSTIEFKAEKDFTGEYECQEFGVESSRTSNASVYIYVVANEPYLVLNSKGTHFIKINAGSSNGYILPCAVSNPSILVDLEKDKENVTDLNSFDPKVGFRINNTAEYGLFKCTARGSSSYLELDVVEPKGLHNEGNSADLDKTKTSITLNMYKNEKEKPTFECLGASSMTAIACNTPVECDFFRKCAELQGLDDCKVSTKIGEACNNREDCRIVTFENLISSSGGIIICSNSDSKVLAEFKFFVNKEGEPKLEENATSKDTMGFGRTKDGSFITLPYVYVGQLISFQCNASKNVHSKELQWGFAANKNAKFDEAHLIYPIQDEDKNETLANVYSRTTKISFVHPGLLKLHGKTFYFLCRAPRLDSTEYDVRSHPLELRVPPSIHLEGNKTDTIDLDSKDFVESKHYVNCTAIGNAAFRWTKSNGDALKNSTDISITQTDPNDPPVRTSQSITVELTSPDDPITYQCHATNGIDNVTQTRSVTVNFKPSSTSEDKNPPRWVWPAVLGLWLFVLTIITTFGGYRLYKRPRRFPEKIMKDFFYGWVEVEPNSPMKGIVFPPHDKRYEIDPKDVTELGQCGSGQSGLVSIVEYRRRLKKSEIMSATDSIWRKIKILIFPRPRKYAPKKKCVVKSPKKECREDSYLFSEFLKEIKSIIYVGNHENIVKFIGCMAGPSLVKQRKAAFLMEFCALGDLKTYLIKHSESFKDEFQASSASSCYASLHQTDTTSTVLSQISTSNLLHWAYQIACGLEYLTKKIIHRDVAARNVLLTEGGDAKITDFGLSRFGEGDKTYYITLDEPTGTEDGVKKRDLKFPIPWLSIESIKTKRFSEDSDIWAFGVTLWEIFSLGDDPIIDSAPPDLYRNPHLFADYLAQGHRLRKPRAANSAIYDIMLRCWAAKGSDRPRFTELKQLIFEAQSCLKKPGSFSTTDADYTEYSSKSELGDNIDNSNASSTSTSSHGSLSTRSD